MRMALLPLCVALWAQRTSGDAAVAVPLHGRVRAEGVYAVSAALGTPSQTFTLVVDTGSTITHVPCTGSDGGGRSLNPASSATYAPLACEGECAAAGGQCKAQNRCEYSRRYHEQSLSSGELGQELVLLGGANFSTPVGCERVVRGELRSQEADGVLGLGRLGQGHGLAWSVSAARAVPAVVSLCLGGALGGGRLELGRRRAKASAASSPLLPAWPSAPVFTPLKRDARTPHFFRVSLRALSLGGEALGTFGGGRAGADAAVREALQRRDAVLDTGSTFTYLAPVAFNAFSRALAALTAHRKVPGPDGSFPDVCYQVAAGENVTLGTLERHFPELVLTLEGAQGKPVRLSLSPHSYLFVHGRRKDAFCLGVFADAKAPGPILGATMLRNLLVELDLEREQVGFARARCNALEPALAPQ
mmetsp:Transcript_16164/g.52841  ORF Transcript_16164/g.52841 Transcript_16164/m.52841 type:complete len:418 (-) Transcript_16164:813-2066(-)